MTTKELVEWLENVVTVEKMGSTALHLTQGGRDACKERADMFASAARRLAVLEEEVEAGRACIDEGQLKNGFERFFWSLNIRCADRDRLDAARAATDKERANG